jgi:hypothetical protein
MNSRNVIRILAGLLVISTLHNRELLAQAEHKVICIGFYNLENLFDPADDPDLDDAEFTPTGSYHYTEEIYLEKLDHLADVISRLGTEVTPDGVSLLGVSEIENRKVLEDLVAHPDIRDRNYQIVHYDSRDHRGIDVGLLYQGKYFQVDSSTVIPLITEVKPGGDTSFSRDILIVYGKIDGEPIAISVNHWPSRRGGEKATAPLRNKAAEINKHMVDCNTIAGMKTIVMGDFNDDPVNVSVKDILRASGSSEKLIHKQMFNPFYTDFRRGNGTTAYQDAWSLFDQIILSSNLTNDKTGYHFYKSRVFNEPFLTQKMGQYKGYPFRTYSGSAYIGGYSDHFPVYVFLIKRI